MKITPSPSIKNESEPHAEFSWVDNQDLVVVEHQPAIAVHANNQGGIVIRQEDFWGSSDQVLYFRVEHAKKIVDAILALAKGIK